jgi:hypothetical protein
MNDVASATGRMLALGVVASTLQLVRSMADGHAPAAVQDLMQERRRLLAELARNVDSPVAVGSLAALAAAVAESDRTLGALIG